LWKVVSNICGTKASRYANAQQVEKANSVGIQMRKIQFWRNRKGKQMQKIDEDVDVSSLK